jgi:hypothetical protein
MEKTFPAMIPNLKYVAQLYKGIHHMQDMKMHRIQEEEKDPMMKGQTIEGSPICWPQQGCSWHYGDLPGHSKY